MIGIIADSHARTETIVAALKILKDYDCRHIYHLGDVCDSAHPEKAEVCLRPLRKHDVITIKGNNEQTIIANHRGRKKTPVPPAVLRFLQSLPLVERYRNAIFTHSLPFSQELGLACMIGVMGQTEARRFFCEFPQHILFRGHSHSPEIVWQNGRDIGFRPLRVGEKFDLKGRIPCVVTCGALTRGFCMVWKPEENYIESLSFGPREISRLK